jgi:predicted secreted protein
MASKSCTLNVSAKSIVKTSPTSGNWEEVLSGKKSWNLTTNHLVKAATAEAPTHIFSHAEIEITNSMADGWHVVGNGLNGRAV